MEMVVEVIGMKCFKGRVDGTDIDGGSLYSIVKMDERYNRKDDQATNWKFGHAIEEWKLPNAEMVMRLSHLKPSIKNPVAMKLEVERVSNGREVKEMLINVEPVNGTMIDQQTGEIRTPAAQPVRKVA